MPKKPEKLLIVLLALAWVFDFLFWESAIGINLVILLEITLISAGYLLFKEGFQLARRSVWLLLPIAFFSMVTVIRREPLTLFLAYLFSFLLMAILINDWIKGHWIFYNLADYFKKVMRLIGSTLTKSAKFTREILKLQKERENRNVKTIFMPVLRGVLIALPIVTFFAVLLTSADLIFADRVKIFLDNFSADKISEILKRSMLSLLFAYLIGGVFLHAMAMGDDKENTERQSEQRKRVLGFIESSIILGSVGLLFLAFVMIQFRYFFGGTENIGVEGYSYSQYARRGFNELITVVFFSLLLIISLSSLSRQDGKGQRNIFSGLVVLVVVQVLIILVSAYQRISLGIQWHGFSRLRLYPRVFLIWLGLLLVVIVFLEIYKNQKFFAFAALVASLGFAVSLALMNVDASIIEYNLLRVTEGKHFNPTHLASLSTDAVPALVDEFLYSDLPVPVREGVGAILLCYASDVDSVEDWRSFNLSTWRANQALKKVESSLLGYHMNSAGLSVRAPSRNLYFCSGVY